MGKQFPGAMFCLLVCPAASVTPAAFLGKQSVEMMQIRQRGWKRSLKLKWRITSDFISSEKPVM